MDPPPRRHTHREIVLPHPHGAYLPNDHDGFRAAHPSALRKHYVGWQEWWLSGWYESWGCNKPRKSNRPPGVLPDERLEISHALKAPHQPPRQSGLRH